MIFSKDTPRCCLSFSLFAKSQRTFFIRESVQQMYIQHQTFLSVANHTKAPHLIEMQGFSKANSPYQTIFATGYLSQNRTIQRLMRQSSSSQVTLELRKDLLLLFWTHEEVMRMKPQSFCVL